MFVILSAKKETAKEKMLKEEERILESVAEKKGFISVFNIVKCLQHISALLGLVLIYMLNVICLSFHICFLFSSFDGCC